MAGAPPTETDIFEKVAVCYQIVVFAMALALASVHHSGHHDSSGCFTVWRVVTWVGYERFLIPVP